MATEMDNLAEVAKNNTWDILSYEEMLLFSTNMF